MDLSLAEIAKRNKVSRYAVQDSLKRAISVLEEAEKALALLERNRKIEKLTERIADERLAQRIKDLL